MIITTNCFSHKLDYPVFRTVIKNNKYFSLQKLLNNFPSSNMATLRKNRKIAAINRNNHEDHPWITRLKTQMLFEFSKFLLLRCQRKLRVEWQKNSLMSSVGRKVTFWGPYQDLINFFWTEKPGSRRSRYAGIPEFKRRTPGIEWRQVPKKILVLKLESPWANPHRNWTRRRPLTGALNF